MFPKFWPDVTVTQLRFDCKVTEISGQWGNPRNDKAIDRPMSGATQRQEGLNFWNFQWDEIYWTPIKSVKELENLRDLRGCGYDPAVSPMCGPLTCTEQRSRPSNSRSDRRSDQELWRWWSQQPEENHEEPGVKAGGIRTPGIDLADSKHMKQQNIPGSPA